jgi:hypothetical protein
MGRSSFGKRAREQAKKAKASAKQERRQRLSERVEEDTAAAANSTEDSPLGTERILEMLASVHDRFQAGTMSYEDFESAKSDLLGRLSVE